MKERPEIKTELPGPNAKLILEKDNQYLSPSYTRPYPAVIKKGRGVWLWDVDGNKFLDMNAGIAVVSTGHSHPEVVQAIKDQADNFIHMSGTDFYYSPQVELAEKLAEIVPGAQNKRVFLCNSGTETVEAALKLSRLKTKRNIFMGFLGGFHGRSLGSLSITASKAIQRKGYSPLQQTVHVPFPNTYRPPFGVSPEKVGDVVLDYIENTLFQTVAPPEDVAAFIIEPVQGEGGYLIPPMDFWGKLKDLLDKYNILFVDDEVQSGMGRTGKMFAIEHFGVIPDITLMAKGIASGMPLGAVCANRSLMDWPPGSHASTFGGNPISCAAAIKTIELLEGGLVENAERIGLHFLERLTELQEKYECIGDVRGLGLMVALEIVEDSASRKPCVDLRNKIIQECFKKGLLLLGAGKSVLRFMPPLVVSQNDVDVAIEILDDTIQDILNK
jgi:4-aminobutyrate aminotransferase